MFRAWFAEESKKMKILSLPKYDDKTDSFVDGPLPKSADSFFNNSEKMKEFFDLNLNVEDKKDSH